MVLKVVVRCFRWSQRLPWTAQHRGDLCQVPCVFFREQDALKVFNRASYRSIKSYLTKTCIGHDKNKLKNQDILAQESRLDIYCSSCFVEYSPNPIASCEFKSLWFKNQAQLSAHLWRTCLQRIFQIFLQLMAITLYMQAEIVRSSFTGRGDPSDLISFGGRIAKLLRENNSPRTRHKLHCT